jgi:basic amino acid/polyamine antiporter, APA family
MDSRAKLGLWTGVGIVVANMIGSGVLITPGFMAMDLAPSHILLAWVLGGVIALSGARAYAAVAQAIPRSGGEYRYLSELWHPALGYLAGWTSLLIGFSQPVAADAIAVGAFADTLFPGLNVQILATVVILAATALHAFDLRVSKHGQNVLVAVKFVLVLGFVAVGLFAGTNHVPTWRPDAAAHGLPAGPFFGSLVFIGFCYSGWNAAIYASSEFAAPRRDVPRAMLIGCALVMVVYLLVNWVFVANLTPADYGQWISGDRDRITLGHTLMLKLIGPTGAKVMSVFVIVALLSATSAMTMIGPRVYAAMARDGFLPRALAGKEGKPPLGALLLQAAVALFCVWTQDFRGLIGTVGAVLSFMAALTALGVLRLQFDERFADARPGPAPLAAMAIFAIATLWILYLNLKNPFLKTAKLPGGAEVASWVVWLVFVALVSVVYVVWTRVSARAPASSTKPAR